MTTYNAPVRRAEDEDLDQFVEDDAVIDPRPMADQRVGWAPAVVAALRTGATGAG